MKRITSIVAALLVFGAVNASAQLSIGNKSEGPERIATLQQMWAWLYRTQEGYFFVCKTDNQFDDSIWLDLGPTKEEAAATVQSLIDALNEATKGERLEIESRGEKYMLLCETTMGIKYWTVHGLDTRTPYAGYGPMDPSALKKAMKELTKK